MSVTSEFLVLQLAPTIGINISKEETIGTDLDPAKLIAKFEVRPKKYAETEIIIEGKIRDGIDRVMAEDANALNLTVGDAIRRTVDFPSIGKAIPIIAEGKMADWLEEAEAGKTQKFKLRFLFGTYTRVDWSEEGPISNLESESGYKLMEIIEQ